jgi:hypothetical protein
LEPCTGAARLSGFSRGAARLSGESTGVARLSFESMGVQEKNNVYRRRIIILDY